jgi:excisionase family DNA binding protein
LEEVPRFFRLGVNVGLVCGKLSGWRVDVDLDVEEAVAIAGRFLSPTLTSGRESRPQSHWWYVSPGAENTRWKDTDGKTLVELRSTGCQTLVAPSTHPSGEQYLWHSESGLSMVEIETPELEKRCREVATATLIARHLPEIRDKTTGDGGGRHDYAMAAAGFLLRPGRLGESATLKILKAAWDAMGWPYELIARGDLPAVRIGERSIRVNRQELERFLLETRRLVEQ